MGWNSWDCYGADVSEEQAKANADYMAANLASHGWEYVVVDIRWYVSNQTTGTNYNQSNPAYTLDEWGRYLPAENRFPSSAGGAGFKPLADYLHEKGLKFGIHIMRGVPKKAVTDKLPIKGTEGLTDGPVSADQITVPDNPTYLQCTWLKDNYTIDASRPGAQEYYDSIFELYASWGVDFVKVDDLSRPYHKDEIELIRNAIDKTGRPIVFSMSPGATPLVEAEHADTHANMWRLVDDFWDNWDHVAHEFTVVGPWAPYIGGGSWPDADMLPFGRLCKRGGVNGSERWTNFTKDEQYTVMTLFTIMRSPLMFGGNLPDNDSAEEPNGSGFTNSLLTNDEVLYVNQHGKNPREVYNKDGVIVWVSDDEASEDKFAAVFDTASLPAVKVFTLQWNLLGFSDEASAAARDLWARQDAGSSRGGFVTEIPAHGAALYRFTP